MTIYHKEKPSSIQSLFDAIAPRYDIGNSLNSFHLHAFWNYKLSSLLMERFIECPCSKTILDLCAGTGEITWRLLAHAKKRKLMLPQIHLVDFSSEMLQIAKNRSLNLSQEEQSRLVFLQADAQALPIAESTFDAVSIAYGIRNVQHVEKCIGEVYRVLNDGGWLGIVELTRPKKNPLRYMHGIYLKTVLPLVGKWAIRNEEAYQYLCNSIQSFICPERLLEICAETGFENLSSIPLMGGIATLFFARKPKRK